MKRRTRYSVAILAAAAVAFSAGCASEGDGAASTDKNESKSDVTVCQVTDTGGVDDRSFNQTAHEGVLEAQKELGITPKLLESTSETDFEPNMDKFLNDDCTLIVPVGFLLDSATQNAAKAHPDQKFAIVDVDFFDSDAKKDISYDNVKELTFATDQAAFLAGYAAAGASKSGIVGTYGGIQIPTVTIFMDGFLAGVQQYNKDFDKTVKVLGWDGKTGLFVGDFSSTDTGKDYTKDMIDEGADIIMPVAGPVGKGTLSEIKSRNNPDLGVVWVDVDGCSSLPDDCKYFLTSVEKKMDVAVFDAIKSVVDGDFKGGLYVGTLENKGVDIADFQDWDSKVPDDVKAKIEDYRTSIIDGSQTLTPN